MPSRRAKSLTADQESTPTELLVASSSQLEKAIQMPTFNMSFDEWSERYRAMVAAGAFMEEQFRFLSTARIENAVPAVDAADGAEQLTPQQFADRIRLMLEANPALLSGGTTNALVHAFKELPESPSGFRSRPREL